MAVELRHLRYFAAVARERNFTRAAEKLHIAQPPLSRQVQQLEDELGIDLIEPGSRPLRLTEAGRLFYEQAVQVLERIDEMKAMVGRLRDADRTRFSMGFVASTLYGKLPDVIRRYRAARPDVDLTCSNSPASNRSPPLRRVASTSASGVSRWTIPRWIASCCATRS
jgi:LysR family transcriptional regulator, benzoate and cis,cis-muconate-responsive activator of ben and cat genes